MEFMEALPPVVDRLMSLFALGIGFPEDFFKSVRCPCAACSPQPVRVHNHCWSWAALLPTVGPGSPAQRGAPNTMESESCMLPVCPDSPLVSAVLPRKMLQPCQGAA